MKNPREASGPRGFFHARKAAIAAGPSGMTASVSPPPSFRRPGEQTKVTVDYAPSFRVPLIGWMLGADHLSATVTMQIEQP